MPGWRDRDFVRVWYLLRLDGPIHGDGLPRWFLLYGGVDRDGPMRRRLLRIWRGGLLHPVRSGLVSEHDCSKLVHYLLVGHLRLCGVEWVLELCGGHIRVKLGHIDLLQLLGGYLLLFDGSERMRVVLGGGLPIKHRLDKLCELSVGNIF